MQKNDGKPWDLGVFPIFSERQEIRVSWSYGRYHAHHDGHRTQELVPSGLSGLSKRPHLDPFLGLKTLASVEMISLSLNGWCLYGRLFMPWSVASVQRVATGSNRGKPQDAKASADTALEIAKEKRDLLGTQNSQPWTSENRWWVWWCFGPWEDLPATRHSCEEFNYRVITPCCPGLLELGPYLNQLVP